MKRRQRYFSFNFSLLMFVWIETVSWEFYNLYWAQWCTKFKSKWVWVEKKNFILSSNKRIVANQWPFIWYSCLLLCRLFFVWFFLQWNQCSTFIYGCFWIILHNIKRIEENSEFHWIFPFSLEKRKVLFFSFEIRMNGNLIEYLKSKFSSRGCDFCTICMRKTFFSFFFFLQSLLTILKEKKNFLNFLFRIFWGMKILSPFFKFVSFERKFQNSKNANCGDFICRARDKNFREFQTIFSILEFLSCCRWPAWVKRVGKIILNF